MQRIAVLGAGRMGRQIITAVAERRDCQVSGMWSRDAATVAGIAGYTDLSRLLADSDIAIDFTLATATSEVLRAVVAAKVPLVCGVSGLTTEQAIDLDVAARSIPLLYDRNMSYGVAVMSRLAEQAAAAFGEGYRVEVHETHHTHKLDAPSGTALKLGEALARGRGRHFDDIYHYEPQPGGAALADDKISFYVRREGEVPGDHRVEFLAAAETLTLSHSVTDRRVFADGALAAARWLATQAPGRYEMTDVLL